MYDIIIEITFFSAPSADNKHERTKKMATILLAGGAGYIGSHTAVELLEAGYDVVVADNFANSSPEAIRRVEKITGKNVKLYELDIKDNEKLAEVFRENSIDAVIHFAGLKAVGESVAKPVMYYRNNIDTTLSLLENMNEFGVKCMRIYLMLIPLFGINIATGVFFQAIGYPTQSSILSLSKQIIFQLPVTVIIPMFLGLDGVLYAGPVSDFLTFVLTVVLLFVYWKKIFRGGRTNTEVN